MRRFALLTCGLTAALLLAGCSTLRAPVVPASGFVFTDTKAPLDIDYDSTDLGSKIGTAESISILGLVAVGDASAAAAARDGNITTIKHADYENFSVLGLFTRFRIIVYGD